MNNVVWYKLDGLLKRWHLSTWCLVFQHGVPVEMGFLPSPRERLPSPLAWLPWRLPGSKERCWDSAVGFSKMNFFYALESSNGCKPRWSLVLWTIYRFRGFFEVVLIFLVVVSNSFHFFHPRLGKIPTFTNIFQMGWYGLVQRPTSFLFQITP